MIAREEPFASERWEESLREHGVDVRLGATAAVRAEGGEVTLELETGGPRARRRAGGGDRPPARTPTTSARDASASSRASRSRSTTRCGRRTRLAVRDRRRERPRAAHPHGQVPGAHRGGRDPGQGWLRRVDRRRLAVAARDLHRPAGGGCRATPSTRARRPGSTSARSTCRPGNAGASFYGRETRPAPPGWSSTTPAASSSAPPSPGLRSPSSSTRRRSPWWARPARPSRPRGAVLPTRSEVWLYLLEALGIAGPCGAPPRRSIRGKDVVVEAGAGQIGLRVAAAPRAGGRRPRGLVRNPNHVTRPGGGGCRGRRVRHGGAREISGLLRRRRRGGVAAGAGPGSGPERKRTVASARR